jgi:hypothetical protein
MTLEAFARVHKLPPCWLELRKSCEEIVRHADFCYRPDLRQQASDLAVRASDILQLTLKQRASNRPVRADALITPRIRVK